MEKLIYVVWKNGGVPIGDFRQQMLRDVASRLIELGAHALCLNLADDLAVPGLKITSAAEPLSGAVGLWLDSHLNRAPFERVLAAAAERLAGYLVVESVPLPNTSVTAARGERIPGLYNVAFLEKPASLTYETWLRAWQGEHTRVALEAQSTFLYVQNVVVRSLTAGAPPWTAIVEEAFPAEAAEDPMVFYNAAGSPEKLKEHQRRLMDSCERFIDFSHFETHPMSSYVIKHWAD